MSSVVVVRTGIAEFARVAGVGTEGTVLASLADGTAGTCVGIAVLPCSACVAALADGSDAEQAGGLHADRVATFAVFCVGEGAVVDLAWVAGGAAAVGGNAVQAGETGAVAVTALAFDSVCSGAVGNRAVDRGSFVASAGGVDAVVA